MLTSETKRQRFNKVAAARVNKIVHMIRLLANCSNTNNYDYTTEEISAMFSELQNTLDECRAAYTQKPGQVKNLFSFDS